MYTAGNEGYIRVFDLFQDTLDNPALIEYHDDMCTDVSCSVSTLALSFQPAC